MGLLGPAGPVGVAALETAGAVASQPLVRVGCGSDVRLEAYATDDCFGKRGAPSVISTNNDNQLRA
jgi:hypothetical protein